jgi:hypothetical protein
MDDDELIRRLKDDDPQALDFLITSYSRVVGVYISRLNASWMPRTAIQKAAQITLTYIAQHLTTTGMIEGQSIEELVKTTAKSASLFLRRQRPNN